MNGKGEQSREADPAAQLVTALQEAQAHLAFLKGRAEELSGNANAMNQAMTDQSTDYLDANREALMRGEVPPLSDAYKAALLARQEQELGAASIRWAAWEYQNAATRELTDRYNGWHIRATTDDNQNSILIVGERGARVGVRYANVREADGKVAAVDADGTVIVRGSEQLYLVRVAKSPIYIGEPVTSFELHPPTEAAE